MVLLFTALFFLDVITFCKCVIFVATFCTCVSFVITFCICVSFVITFCTCVSLLATYQSLLFFIFIFLCYHILHMCLFATFLLLLELMTFYKCGCQCLLFIYLFCICEYTKTLLHSMEYYQLFIKALLSHNLFIHLEFLIINYVIN